MIKAGRQVVTYDWWLNTKSKYEIYISALVEEEISGGDPMVAAKRLQAIANIPSILINHEAQLLADALVLSKAVPGNSVRDALHIAIAATQGIDYLLTWNFKHISRNKNAHGPCYRSRWLGLFYSLLTRRTWR